MGLSLRRYSDYRDFRAVTREQRAAFMCSKCNGITSRAAGMKERPVLDSLAEVTDCELVCIHCQ